MTNAASTSEQFDAEMARLVGNIKPGQPRARYTEYVEEVRRRYGDKPYRIIRHAVTLIITGSPTDLPLAGNEFWGMYIREAERQIADIDRLERGQLPLDESAREREERETYQRAYELAGPGTEAFEWSLCAGIAKARRRERLRATVTDLDTAAAFRSPFEKEQFGPGLDEPTEAEVRDVYDERRREGIAIGRSPTATSTQVARDTGNLSPALRDPARWLKQSGGFKTTREIMEERRREGRLEPRMEAYFLDKIAEEERGDQT